ncbi:TPA: LysR family transcriptional regulator, partial [Raoultella planticola]|nr:LysR family transcriptional regulator [Raoultella planticola]
MSMPPLYALRAFETAARLGSFSKAAAALHVTPGAISRHISTLEAWFD